MRVGHHAIVLLFGALALVSLACNAFAGGFEPLPEPPDLTRRPSLTPTTPGMAATATLSGAIVTEVTATVRLDLNVRSGPGVQYERLTFLPQGDTVPVVGVDPLSGWLKIPCPDDLASSDCWISGGERYVTVSQPENLPTAEAPPTPTTVPPAIEADRGMLAYVDNGRLHVARLDVAADLPRLVGDGEAIGAATAVQTIAFSPDGRHLAYVSGNDGANSLQIINVDGSDERALVTSNILPLAAGFGAAQAAVLVDIFRWLPDSSGIAFNTRTQNLAGPGAASQEDLWVVTLGGELLDLFAAGEGGGAFLIEPDGRLWLSRQDEIARANLNQADQDVVLTFDPVDTASEFAYYPQPQWTQDGVRLAVPPANPWVPGAVTSLWRLTQTGPAVEIGHVSDAALDHPLTWSDDGQKVAYIQHETAGDQAPLQLVIADGDGSDEMPYSGGSRLAFLSWQPAGQSFVYAGERYFASGRAQSPPQQTLLPAGIFAGSAGWITESDYLVALQDPQQNRWELRGVTPESETVSLVEGDGSSPSFDLWLP